MIARLFALVAALVLCGLSARADKPEVLLGALEDVPGKVAGEPHHNALRVLFRKTGGEWLPFPSDCDGDGCLHDLATHYPASVQWNIGFSGKYLGGVTGHTPATYDWYSDAGLQNIAGHDAAPKVGKRSADFGGFTGEAVYRPLEAVSEKNLGDPDNWRRAKPSAEVVARLRHAFRARFPAVSNCRSETDENSGPWAYRDENIKVERFYASARRWWVAEVALQKYRCDGPPDDAFIDQWFAISPDGEIVFLDGGLWVVDAGDYDGDGKSELLFAIDRYDEGGYTLYYDDFRRHATFSFHYH